MKHTLAKINEIISSVCSITLLSDNQFRIKFCTGTQIEANWTTSQRNVRFLYACGEVNQFKTIIEKTIEDLILRHQWLPVIIRNQNLNEKNSTNNYVF